MGRRPSAAPSTGLARLEELRADVAAAEERVRELEAEAKKAERRIDAAKAPLLGYWADVEAGRREPDEVLEAELLSAVRTAEGSVSLSVIHDSGGARLRATDDETTARLQGAREVVQQRKDALSHYVVDAREELVADLVPRSEAAWDVLSAAIDGLREAEGKWNGVRNQWLSLIDQWGIERPQLPTSPASAAIQELERSLAPMFGPQVRDPRRLIPAPVSLLPGPEVERVEDVGFRAATRADAVRRMDHDQAEPFRQPDPRFGGA
jgi:hypothetical protein